jgi:ATP-binding protein involved in chromosome partitioning
MAAPADREKALDTALAQIDRQFGKGSVMRLGDDVRAPIETIPTGSIALQTHQQIVGVIENMSWLELPDGSRMDVFGSGGGQAVADSLTRSVGATVPLLGQVPLDVTLREGGDGGTPVVLGSPDSPAAVALRGIARQLSRRARGLAGRSLGLTPAARR